MFLSKLLRAADHPYLEGANGRKVTKNNYFILNSLNLQSCQDPCSKIETIFDFRSVYFHSLNDEILP